jgi:hypothetical protein
MRACRSRSVRRRRRPPGRCKSPSWRDTIRVALVCGRTCTAGPREQSDSLSRVPPAGRSPPGQGAKLASRFPFWPARGVGGGQRRVLVISYWRWPHRQSFDHLHGRRFTAVVSFPAKGWSGLDSLLPACGRSRDHSHAVERKRGYCWRPGSASPGASRLPVLQLVPVPAVEFGQTAPPLGPPSRPGHDLVSLSLARRRVRDSVRAQSVLSSLTPRFPIQSPILVCRSLRLRRVPSKGRRKADTHARCAPPRPRARAS